MSTIEKDPARGMNGALSRVLRGEASRASLSYDELAEAVGVSKSTINRVLRKEGPTRHLDAALIEGICRVVNADVVEVWQRAARLEVGVDDNAAEGVEEGSAAYRRGHAEGRDIPEGVGRSVTRRKGGR